MAMPLRSSITQFLTLISDKVTCECLRPILESIGDRYSSQPLRTAGLVIKAGGGVLAKIGAVDYYGIVKGKLVTIAASTDMPSLVNYNIAANKYNVICFFIDGASVVTAVMGSEGSAIANVLFPVFPKGKALVGFLLITNGASVFTGGTTALDTATTVYVSPIGAFDPIVLL